MKKFFLICLVFFVVLLSGCTQPIPQLCSDTDGGTNYFVKGTLNSLNTDFCNWNWLVEYTCESPSSSYQSVHYDCPLGCKDGACIKEETVCGDGLCEGLETREGCPSDCNFDGCIDTDEGDHHIKGVLIPFGLVDHCNEYGRLVEYSCGVNPYGTNFRTITCSCYQGGCLP